MRLKRITDAEFMEYLDGNLTPDETVQFDKLLQDDPADQERMDSYEAIYASLEGCELPELSPQFADKVMAALPPAAPKRVGLGFKGNVAVVVFGLIFVNILAYIVDLRPVIDLIGSLSMPEMPEIGRLIAQYDSVMEQLQRFRTIMPFLGVAAAITLFYTFLENILLHPPAHRG